jgi:60 kDa SS-A/Ro ribonucleoprotein
LVRIVAEGRGQEVLDLVFSVSKEGRTAKQGPTLFAFAYLCRALAGRGGGSGGGTGSSGENGGERVQIGTEGVQRKAYDCLREVCRIPTHLFEFVAYCEKLNAGGTTGKSASAVYGSNNHFNTYVTIERQDSSKMFTNE